MKLALVALFVCILFLATTWTQVDAASSRASSKSNAPQYIVVDGGAAAVAATAAEAGSSPLLTIPEGDAIYQQQQLPTITPDVVQQFVDWMTTYGKTYASPDQQSYHLNVFAQNRQFVIEHNARADAGLVSYRVELNAFADLSSEEWAQRVKLLTPAVSYPNLASVSGPAEDKSATSELPAAVDWRAQNIVSEVKDQSACAGASWAFSAIGAVEGAYALRSGKVVSLSEQLLVDCAGRTVSQDICKTGGITSIGLEFLAAHGGAMTQSSYPYTGESFGTCKFDPAQVVVQVSTWHRITLGSEAELARAVATHPAVAVSIDARSRGFQLYAEGVYEEEACATDANELTHAAVVVGYGVAPVNDTPYWIVKNSWGTQWGLGGYILMRKDGQGEHANHCGIASNAIFVNK